jgi:hypothetical protein
LISTHEAVTSTGVLHECSHTPPTIELLNCGDNGLSLGSSLGKYHCLFKHGIRNINGSFHASIITQFSIHIYLYWSIRIWGRETGATEQLYLAQPCEPLLRDFRSQCATNKHVGIRNT